MFLIESSADDTAVAIVDGATKKILSNIVMKQHAQCVLELSNSYRLASSWTVVIISHQIFGGIHPNVAIQWHQRNLVSITQTSLIVSPLIRRHQPFAVQQALKNANMRVQDVDGIAFTRGPGIHLPNARFVAKVLTLRNGRMFVCFRQRSQDSSSCSEQANRWCTSYDSTFYICKEVYLKQH